MWPVFCPTVRRPDDPPICNLPDFYFQLFLSLFVLRLPSLHTRFGQFMQKIYISVRPAVERDHIQLLVRAELERFSFGAKSYGRTSITNGVVSSIVHHLFAVHGDQFTARNECVRCRAGDTNCINENYIEQAKMSTEQMQQIVSICISIVVGTETDFVQMRAIKLLLFIYEKEGNCLVFERLCT